MANPWELNWGNATPTDQPSPLGVRPDPVPQQPVTPMMDYNRPDEQVRADIGAIPDETARTKAMNQWADTYVRNENKNAGIGRGIDNVVRAIARGMPGGTWLDELNAAGQGVPEQYDERLAYQRARDRSFAYAHPVQNAASLLTGATAAAPFTTVTGGGPAINTLANAAINTVLGAISGAGDANSGDRGTGAAWGAGTSAAASGLLAPLAMWGQRYSQGRTTPEVNQAAGQLGVDIPYFARSSDPRVQAAGRQMAQERPGSNLAQSWFSGREGLDQAGSNVVRDITQAPRETAPAVVGQAVQGGMTRAGQAATTEMAQIARDIEALLPPGYRGDPAELRNVAQAIMNDRAAAGHINPGAGLEQTMNLATQPGGATWRGLGRYTTELGESVGRPDIVPGPVSHSDLRRLYAGVQGVDRPNIIQAAAGQRGLDEFTQGTARQAELAALRDQIEAAVGNRQPEQLVKLAHDAATLSGGGTRLNQLATIVNALTPAEQQQLAAGVLAQIQNTAKGVPSGVATRIGAMPQQSRDTLFPPGSPLAGNLNDIQTLAERLGAVDRMQHVGSAKTMSPTIRSMGFGGAGPLAGGWLGYALGHPWIGAALGTAAAGGREINDRLIRPYVLQHGIPQGLQDRLAPAAGMARVAPQELYQPQR